MKLNVGRLILLAAVSLLATGCQAPPPPAWELANPVEPLPEPPLGAGFDG